MTDSLPYSNSDPADSTQFDSYANAFIMSKYGNSFAKAANSFEILQILSTFVHNTKAKHQNLEYVRSTSLKPWWTMDDFLLHLEHILVLNSKIKCPCQVAGAQAHSIQALSIVQYPVLNFKLEGGVHPTFYPQIRSTSHFKHDFISH